MHDRAELPMLSRELATVVVSVCTDLGLDVP